MAKEIKIGLLALVAILLSVWGYQFVKGNNLLVSTNHYYVMYTDVAGLQVGTAVQVNGVKIGSVADVQLLNDDLEHVLVELDLDKGIRIPKEAVAAIITGDLMGSKAVSLEYSKPCKGEGCASAGDYLKGETRGMISSLMPEEELAAILSVFADKMGELADSINYILLSEESGNSLGKTVKDISGTAANLNGITGQLNSLLAASSRDIKGTLNNVNQLTAELAANKESLSNILANVDTTTAKLAKVDVEATMANIQATMASLQKTLTSADSSLTGLSTLMNDVNAGKGSLGKLLKDDEIANNLSEMTTNINKLAKDFKEKPYRYMPLKSRNKVQKYDKKDGNN